MNIVSVTDGAGAVCEDLANSTDAGAWVLDGSSGAIHAGHTSAASDGRWYVDRFDAFLTTHLEDDEPLPDIIRAGVDTLDAAYRSSVGEDVDTVEHPLAAGAVVRFREDMVDFLLAADCSLALQRPDGTIETIFGDGPRELDTAVVEAIVALQEAHGYTHEEAKAETREMIVDARRQLNSPGGYWALSFDPRAVDHARGSTIPRDDLSALLLFSDGFERAMELFEATSYEEVFDHVRSGDIEPLIDRLRRRETEDADCTAYPRIKRHDDAALLGTEFEQ